MAWNLVSVGEIETPDLILIDNLDSNFLLFEAAADLKKSRLGEAAPVPVAASWKGPAKPGLVEP